MTRSSEITHFEIQCATRGAVNCDIFCDTQCVGNVTIVDEHLNVLFYMAAVLEADIVEPDVVESMAERAAISDVIAEWNLAKEHIATAIEEATDEQARELVGDLTDALRGLKDAIDKQSAFNVLYRRPEGELDA